MHSHIIEFSHDNRMYFVWLFRDRTDALLMIIREADPIVGGCEINDFWRWKVELNSLVKIINNRLELSSWCFDMSPTLNLFATKLMECLGIWSTKLYEMDKASLCNVCCSKYVRLKLLYHFHKNMGGNFLNLGKIAFSLSY